MTGLKNNPLSVAKTFKLFIGGDFPRTESGRSFPVYYHKSQKIYAHLCLGSRKDFRNAVTVAKEAQKSWAHKSAYNRGQILYRVAEMLEGKRAEFLEILQETLGYSKLIAESEISGAIRSAVYYAGFTDKYQQLIGAVNPVSGPHHNFTTCEPMGTVCLISSEAFSLPNLLTQICSILASGNSIVVLMQSQGGACIAPLAEAFATADVPKGVINLITGDINELIKHIGSHMEVQAVAFAGQDINVLRELQNLATENLKRVIPMGSLLNPGKKSSKVNSHPLGIEPILSFVEYKTVWHPIGS